MKREFSIYLDLVRFLAAATVFVGHVSGQRFTAGLLWPVSEFMDAAVIIFFVLSGYVIAFAADTRERSARLYVVSRMARIYSVAIPAILLTFVLDSIGSYFNPAMYQPWWGYRADFEFFRVLSLLSFTNEFWWLHVNFGSLLPYWSLGYEIWYYVLFGIAIFMRGWGRVAVLGAVCLLIGPKILSLFPIWVAGAMGYYFSKNRIPEAAGYMLFAISLAFAALMVAVSAGKFGTSFKLAPSGIITRYAEGAIFLLNIAGAPPVLNKISSVVLRFDKPVRYAAGMTFSLYLVHVPVAQFIAAISPFPPVSSVERVLVLLGTLLVVAVFAHLTEHRKMMWRTWCFRISEYLLPQPKANQVPDTQLA